MELSRTAPFKGYAGIQEQAASVGGFLNPACSAERSNAWRARPVCFSATPKPTISSSKAAAGTPPLYFSRIAPAVDGFMGEQF
jgi:hypothetical protein